MRKRRKHKRMGNMSIICITAIIGLSAMGVGYGYWTDTLNIGVGVSTGYIKPEFVVNELETIGGLTFNIDGNTLFITGNVLPEFDGKIQVGIKNNSTIPVMLDGEVIGVGQFTWREINIPLDMQAKTMELTDEDISLIQTVLNEQDEEFDIDELIKKLDIKDEEQTYYTIYDKLTFEQGL